MRTHLVTGARLLFKTGEPVMKEDMFEINWKEIRSQTPARWSLMDDHDQFKADEAVVKQEIYVNVLRAKYGYTCEEAEKQNAKRLARFEIV
jgi:hypothetical protein